MPAKSKKSKKSKKSSALVFKVTPAERRMLSDDRSTPAWTGLLAIIDAINACGAGSINWRRKCTSDGSGRLRYRHNFDGRNIGKRIVINRWGYLQVPLAQPRPNRDPKKFNAWVMNIDPKTLRSLSVG
jgi:hypothetical protein